MNLNWSAIMKTIVEDPYAFFQQGGWAFLGGSSGNEVRIMFLNVCCMANLATTNRVTQMKTQDRSRNSKPRMRLRALRVAMTRATTMMALMLAKMRAAVLTFPKAMTATIGMNWRGKLPNVCIPYWMWLRRLLNLFLADKKRGETGKGHESDDSDRPARMKAPAKTNGKTQNGNGKAQNGKAQRPKAKR